MLEFDYYAMGCYLLPRELAPDIAALPAKADPQLISKQIGWYEQFSETGVKALIIALILPSIKAGQWLGIGELLLWDMFPKQVMGRNGLNQEVGLITINDATISLRFGHEILTKGIAWLLREKWWIEGTGSHPAGYGRETTGTEAVYVPTPKLATALMEGEARWCQEPRLISQGPPIVVQPVDENQPGSIRHEGAQNGEAAPKRYDSSAVVHPETEVAEGVFSVDAADAENSLFVPKTPDPGFCQDVRSGVELLVAEHGNGSPQVTLEPIVGLVLVAMLNRCERIGQWYWMTHRAVTIELRQADRVSLTQSAYALGKLRETMLVEKQQFRLLGRDGRPIRHASQMERFRLTNIHLVTPGLIHQPEG